SGLLRIATHDLLRVVDARHAVERWLIAHPRARVVVSGVGFFGEAKIADLLMQRAGITTVDFVHCLVCEGDLRTTFRTRSAYVAAWTEQEVARYLRMGTNQHCMGGYMPRPLLARPTRGVRPRVLVATNYLHANPLVRRKNEKYARRLAIALSELI